MFLVYSRLLQAIGRPQGIASWMDLGSKPHHTDLTKQEVQDLLRARQLSETGDLT